MCRPVTSAGKIGGWISVALTFTTVVNASLMCFFKPEVLKYRAVVGHLVQKVGQKVGQAVRSGLHDFVPSEALSSPDSRATRDMERKSASAPVCRAELPSGFGQTLMRMLNAELQR
jgi:hypothetical protein